MQQLSYLQQAVRSGFAAARANVVPGLVIQLIALALVLAFFFHPPTHQLLQQLEHFKEEAGWWFSALTTMLFGSVVPMGILVLCGRANRYVVRALPLMMVFWAAKGLEIDGMYHLQHAVLGDGLHIGTVVMKVFFDQFVYCTLWAVPTTVVAYQWINHVTGREPFRWLRPWFARQVLPVLLANWGVWVPTVAIIYCLPVALQLPLQNLVLCVWSLLIVLLVERPAEVPTPQSSVNAAA